MKLRPYQQWAIKAFYDYYNHGPARHGLIVLPTAAGKSVVIGKLITEIVQTWNDQRIVLLSHVRELIEQNHNKIMACWPNAPAGIYSAALGKRQAHFPIVSATIQSVYKLAYLFGHVDLVFIDEVHLLNADGTGMYHEFLKGLMEINPFLKVCGLTATDYRLDSGPLIGADNLFQDIIIDIPLSFMIEQGYVTPPIGKSSLVQADMEGVKITGGEFNLKQMAERFDEEAFINAALDNDMPFLQDRRSIAFFAATVGNADHIAQAAQVRGIQCEVLDGSMSPEHRADILYRFRNYQLRAVASVGVMTTGTDVPNIDCVDLFRATQSPGLLQQIVGRGFRTMYADGYDLETMEGRLDAIRNGVKPNFLVLDHGANIERHGPITGIAKPARREKGERVDRKKKKANICEICRSSWPLEVIICGLCGNQMVVPRDATAALEVEASNANILGSPFSRGEVAEPFIVEDVRYFRHKKMGSPDSLMVTYYCGIMPFNEWVLLEHAGYTRTKAENWWKSRSPDTPVPVNVTEALKRVKELNRPSKIVVKKEQNHFRVLHHVFKPVAEECAYQTA